jgi:hypothetical protein
MNGGNRRIVEVGAVQHGHRDSVRARMAVNRLRMVAIEFVT